MRDFSLTEEPRGGAKAGKEKQSGLPFVIQKHAASHLHYDFRLGWNGVLKSWAIAKGPSYFPGDKRLAVQVEDHPMEYGGFEGIIPKGQYGGGTVMLWDHGTWEPQAAYPDVDEGLRKGSLKFTLHGTKMKGNWALVRMGGKAAQESKPNWLLIKEHDEFERSKDDEAIVDEAPDSVLTGRSMDEIAKSEDHVWNSKGSNAKRDWYRNDAKDDGTEKAAKKKATKQLSSVSSSSAALRGAPKEKLPAFLKPQLAQQATAPPGNDGWLYELKLDGYRIQARKDGDTVELLTRTGLDWTHRMPTIAKQVAALPAHRAIFDGEVVVLAANGTTSFADLQAAFQEGERKPLTYFVFDLMHLDGHNLRNLPLVERKAILQPLLEDAGEFIRFSEHMEGDGAKLLRHACELHAEGIIAKRASGKYLSTRSSEWLKLKCIHEQEFVVGGFTLPSNGIHGIGSLLLGYYEKGKLIYAGRTGTGFTQKTHRMLRDHLEKLRAKTCPFHNPPAEARRDAIWAKPEMVAQVHFATWTADNLVRQAAFQGLREDKPPREITREEPRMVPRARGARRATHGAAPVLAAKTSPAKQPEEHAPVRLTHPDKIFDEESQLTKQQLADYYWAIAPYMLPHIAGRPLSLVRCPEGSDKPCFFQKHVNAMLPPGIEAIDVPDKKTGKPEPYITLSTPQALAGLAQMGVLEVHPWGSRNEDLEHPDRIIIDLDPDPAIPWKTLSAAALEVRNRLKKLGLESVLKTTGGKGLHVVVAIQPQHDWTTVKEFAHNLVLGMEKDRSDLYLTKMTKAARKGRIFLDYLRNERGATAVAAFSPRARVGAPVSMPLGWSELKNQELPKFQVTHFDEWRNRLKRDPWKAVFEKKQHLTEAMLQASRGPGRL